MVGTVIADGPVMTPEFNCSAPVLDTTTPERRVAPSNTRIPAVLNTEAVPTLKQLPERVNEPPTEMVAAGLKYTVVGVPAVVQVRTEAEVRTEAPGRLMIPIRV